MSDIVERLRETGDDWPACLVVLELEAANEIEKLRAALKPSQELIERMAKAMWRSTVDKIRYTDEEAMLISGDDWHQFLDYARAAAAALKETE